MLDVLKRIARCLLCQSELVQEWKACSSVVVASSKFVAQHFFQKQTFCSDGRYFLCCTTSFSVSILAWIEAVCRVTTTAQTTWCLDQDGKLKLASHLSCNKQVCPLYLPPTKSFLYKTYLPRTTLVIEHSFLPWFGLMRFEGSKVSQATAVNIPLRASKECINEL